MIAAEWQIIRGINSGENSIESYFRQNTTSRKLIENQFVKIVEDVEALNSEGKNNESSLLLADTLIQIRSSLNEYLRLQGHLGEFERIKAYYQEFARKNDDLLESFSVLEGHKQQVAAIRNLISKDLDGLEQQKTAVKKRQASNAAGSLEGRHLRRLHQAGLVNFEKLQMEAQQEILELERDRLREKGQDLEQRLNHLLTLEGYGEYWFVKGQLSENRKRLQALEEGEDVTKAAYRSAAGRLRFFLARRADELKDWGQSLEEVRQIQSDQLKRAQQERIGEERKQARLEEAAKYLAQAEQEWSTQLAQLNGYFLGTGELEAALAPEQFLGPVEDELNRYQAVRENINEQIDSGAALIQSLTIEAVKTDAEIEKYLGIQQQGQTWLNRYQQERNDLDYKATVLNKNTIVAYREELERLIHREGLHQLEQEIEAGRLRQKKQLSEQRGYYVPNEEVLSLAGQLHGNVNLSKPVSTGWLTWNLRNGQIFCRLCLICLSPSSLIIPLLPVSSRAVSK